MANSYMDSLDTTGASHILKENPNADLDAATGKGYFGNWNANRDGSVYETENVQNSDLKNYIESMREYIARDDYLKHVDKSANAERRTNADFGKSFSYWNDGIKIPDINRAAGEYKNKAKEYLDKIDVNSLSASDYMKLGDVTCNANNIADNLKDKAIDSATLRATIGNLDPNQTATIINRLSAKAQQNFMHNAEVLYPEAIPSKDDMERNASESIDKLLNEKPRPDFRDPLKIKDCISSITNAVHMEHVGEESSGLVMIKNNQSTPKPKSNANRYDIDALAYGTLNENKTDLDFDKF